MKVTIRDVAKHADVSIATVSHVLNETRYVAPETKERVLNSIKEIGYFPNQVGRMLKTGKRNIIGFIAPDIANPVWANIIDVMESVLSEEGFRLIITNSKEDKERELSNIKILATGIADGLVIASTLTSFDDIKEIVPVNFPMVFLDRVVANCPCDTVISTDYQAVYKGVENFILAGHKKIGIITGLLRLSTSQSRLSAYKDAMNDYMLPVEDGFIQYGNSLSKSSIPLVENLINLGCTAFVVSNNVMVNDVINYLQAKNLEIGEDVCVFGQIENESLRYTSQKMQFMVQPTDELASAAAKQILIRLKEPYSPIKNISFSSRLIK